MLNVLRRRNFALFWLAGLISTTGDWVLFIALPFYVYSLTGSTLATGATFIAETLPPLVLGPIAGVLADRWDRQRAMVVADVLRAAVLLLLLAVHSRDLVWIVYIVAVAESVISQFFYPARSAAIPRLVDAEHLVAANSLESFGEAVTRLAGGPAGGALLTLVGLAGVVIADSGSYLGSGILLALISVSLRASRADGMVGQRAPAGSAWGRTWHEWMEGVQIVRQDRLVGSLSAVLALFSMGQGIVNVLLVVFVKEVLHGSAILLGAMVTVQGIGALVGSLSMGRIGRVWRPPQLLGPSLMATGVLTGLFANLPVLPVVMAIGALVGWLAVAITVSSRTVRQMTVHDQFRGRVSGAQRALNAVMTMAGMALAGGLGETLGVVVLLDVAGFIWLAAGVLAVARLAGANLSPVDSYQG